MANRYWVGGSGTWNTTNTNNWAAVSGTPYPGGASVPTASDSVFFDQAGTYTVACTGALTCNDITVSAGTVTFTNGTSPTFAISGSMSLVAGTVWSTTGAITFNATTTGKTITTNGTTLNATTTFNGVGGGWTLGSAFNNGGNTLTVTNGTFDTSSTGNYAVTASSISSNNSNTRTINLNASTVTLSGLTPISFAIDTNLTFNAGTSQINITSSLPTLDAGTGKTFYNVTSTLPGITSLTFNGANTFNNLTFTARTSLGINLIIFSANQTINGTLNLGSPTVGAIARSFFRSNAIGVQRTLTVNSISGLTDIDFRDIVAAGASGTWSGTRLGDCGGNSNITFPAAKTVYYGQTGSANWAATGSGSWSATSGGALDATMFPLAQDTAVFPAATYPASGSTTTISADYNIGTIDMSLRTSNTMTLATSGYAPVIYGNWINGTGITISGINNITFSGRSTQQITSAGIAFTQPIIINAVGTIQLQDSFTTGTGVSTTLSSGTISLQSYTLSTGRFSSSNTATRTIAFGTGNITCTGTGTVWTTSTSIGLTTTGTQVVNVTSTGSTAITVTTGTLSEANSISFNFTGGTYALTFGASTSTYRSINFTGFAGSTVAPTSSIFINGNLTISTGMTLTASSSAVTFAGSSGTQQITTNGKTLDFPITFNDPSGTFQLQDALTMGSTRTATLTNGTLDLNGKTMTVGTAFTTATGTKNLTFNGGTLVCPTASTTAFNNASPTGFTTTAGTGTGTISMTAATAKTFVGGGSTYNCILNQGGAGNLTITGSNTFADITNTVQPATVLFTAGTTTTFTSGFSLSGTAGNLITIGSVTAASHTLSKASGTVSSDYLSISRSTATGGASWYAGANSTNGGNNSGWIFTAPPSGYTAGGQFLAFF